MNWTRTTLPKDLGGLGILNLESFARALRLRWLCLSGLRPRRPGPERIYRVMKPTDSSFLNAPASFWEMATRRASGTQPGSKAQDLRMQCPSSSPRQGTKKGQLRQLYTTIA